jgi:hypothetical protein
MYWAGDANMPTPVNLKVSTGPVEEGSPVAWFDWGGDEHPSGFDPHLSLAVSLNEALTLGRRFTPIPMVDVLDSFCRRVRWEIFEVFRGLFAA